PEPARRGARSAQTAGPTCLRAPSAQKPPPDPSGESCGVLTSAHSITPHRSDGTHLSTVERRLTAKGAGAFGRQRGATAAPVPSARLHRSFFVLALAPAL